MKTSKFLRLGWKDFFKGLIVAIISAVIAFLANELQANASVDLQMLKRVGITSAIALLSYLIKNLFTNNQGDLLIPDK